MISLHDNMIFKFHEYSGTLLSQFHCEELSVQSCLTTPTMLPELASEA
jgi:hypothetical protein